MNTDTSHREAWVTRSDAELESLSEMPTEWTVIGEPDLVLGHFLTLRQALGEALVAGRGGSPICCIRCDADHLLLDRDQIIRILVRSA